MILDHLKFATDLLAIDSGLFGREISATNQGKSFQGLTITMITPMYAIHVLHEWPQSARAWEVTPGYSHPVAIDAAGG